MEAFLMYKILVSSFDDGISLSRKRNIFYSQSVYSSNPETINSDLRFN